MTSNTLSRYATISILGLLLITGGCATSDSYDERDAQMSQERGGGGRMGGGGMGRGGGMGGPPSGMDNGEQTERVIPEEAFIACQGQEAGAEVQFTLPEGKVVDGTCTLVDDHLVALPKQEPARGERPNQ